MKKAVIAIICIVFISSTNSYAQNENSIKLTSRAYGFLIGQDYSLSNIKKKFPDMKLAITKSEIEFNMSFGQAKNNMRKFLTKAMGENYVKALDNDLITEVQKLLPNQKITRKGAIDYIDEVSRRANGEIETPVLEILLSFQYEDSPAREFLSGYKYTFSTKGHPKAKGTDWQIEIPESWKAQEAKRPNIIQSFISRYGSGTETMMLMVMDIGYAPSQKELEQDISDEEIKASLPENARLISNKHIKIDGNHGFMSEYEIAAQRIDITRKSRVLQFVFVSKDKACILLCAVGSIDDEDLSTKMEKYAPLFKMVAGSIVVPGRYK